MRKAGGKPTTDCDFALLTAPEEVELLMLMARLPEVLDQTAKTAKPHHLAQHMLQLAKTFNSYYHSHPEILKQEAALRTARITLTAAVSEVIRIGLTLLGIPAPKEM